MKKKKSSKSIQEFSLFCSSCVTLSHSSLCLFLIDVGFEIPDHFVVGYALDYNEYFRDLNVSECEVNTAAV